MEVSRIEAISPKQIDWRKLTSKEIIKYDAQGVNVPPEYLQWAKEFRNDIEASDKDETTYEMAHSTDTTTQSTASTVQSTESDDTETDENSTETEENPEDSVEKTAAQTKRESLEESGTSLRRQALIFTKDSKTASKETMVSNIIMAATEDKSENEIQKLEMYMKILLAQAESAQNELKAEVDKINEDSSSYSLNKINKLEKQLERYGTQAQTTLASEETQFNEFDATLLAQTGTILNAADFGSETSIIGNELLASRHRGIWAWIIDHIIGKNAVKVGDQTVDRAKSAAENQSEALNTNADNLAKVQDFKTEVENKTGIAATPQAKESDNQNSDNKDNEDSASNTEQNSTETDQAASASIDKILQAKIRKGEEVNTNTA